MAAIISRPFLLSGIVASPRLQKLSITMRPHRASAAHYGATLKMFFSILAVTVGCVFTCNDVLAQGNTPAPLAKVTVSPEVAKRTLMKAVINADTARAIVDACVEWTKQQPGNISI